MRVSSAFIRQMEGYGLTTAQIIYRVPDHRTLLQEFIWQEYDLFPQFPGLSKFLAFWEERIEGPLYSVTVAHVRLARPAELQQRDGKFTLN